MDDTAFWILLACALVLGLVLGRLGAALTQAADERRRRNLQHQVRALEAGLRVAQKSAEDASGRAAAQMREAEESLGRHDDQQRRLSRLEAEAGELRTRLRHECAKTAQLRQELSDRAEAHARTSVELRDARNELDVALYGSDATGVELERVRAERNALLKELETLGAMPPVAPERP